MMPRDRTFDPAFDADGIPGYSADEPLPPADAVEPGPTVADDAATTRGKPAPREGSGVVIGSGAGAGGSGNPEEFDGESAGGGQSNG